MGVKRRFISLTPWLFIQQGVQDNSNEDKGSSLTSLCQGSIEYQRFAIT